MNIGVMGGTFDPIHLGHLAIAEEASLQLDMNRVIFIPAGFPYFKQIQEITPAADRMAMVRLAIGDWPEYELSSIEIERDGPSYAVDTVFALKEQRYPQDDLFFILGWDSLASFYLWKDARRLLSLCRLVAAPRPGFPRPDLSFLDSKLPGLAKCTVLMNSPMVDISSTEIRNRVKNGLPIDHLVPAAVAGYIRQHGLYTAPQT